jgi:FkbM family methyltransferase
MGIESYLLGLLPTSFKFRLKRRMACPDMRLTLQNLRRSGFSPSTVIDVGASDTSWSRSVAEIWPDARFILFEPNPAMKDQCLAFCGPRHVFFDCAVSDCNGSSGFEVEGSNSRLTEASTKLRVSVVTLDAALQDSDVTGPVLLKIDVQGEDLNVVKGGESYVLPRTSVVIIELSLIPLNPIAPGMGEAIARLESAGFRLADICTFWRRPVDDALWQVDAVFVRRDLSYGNVVLGY